VSFLTSDMKIRFSGWRLAPLGGPNIAAFMIVNFIQWWKQNQPLKFCTVIIMRLVGMW